MKCKNCSITEDIYMNLNIEKCIDFYSGEYKNGIFAKKHNIKLYIYPSYIDGVCFMFFDNELSKETESFEVRYKDITRVFIDNVNNQRALFIEYNSNSVVNRSKETIVLPGINDISKWYNLILEKQTEFLKAEEKKQKLESENKENQKRIAIEKENKASKFYNNCFSFHIKESTPTFTLFSENNKIALIYIDENRNLNFLKIDGYSEEENNGIIEYKNIHYYEKAGNISYVSDIHGDYSSYGGSLTGGKISKLATVGGGVLFGLMGMALGAALTYKPAEHTLGYSSFSLDTDIKKIDNRNVMLNFYSDTKKQYIDIELPQDIYNFLQTYLPEKKYGIVDELEKKTVLHQSVNVIEDGSLLRVEIAGANSASNNMIESSSDSINDFKQKVEKLKMMKESGLLTDEEFKSEQQKLLRMI